MNAFYQHSKCCTFVVFVDYFGDEVVREIIEMMIQRIGICILNVQFGRLVVVNVLLDVWLFQRCRVQVSKMLQIGGHDVGNLVVIFRDSHTNVA